MDFKGCKYTWNSNPREGFVTREKLDIVFVNWNWRIDHPHVSAIVLPIISSDHSPIIFIPSPKGRSGRQFKYEAYWEENEECRATVQEGWNCSNTIEDPWGNVLAKVKSCKKGLQKWHHKTFRRVDEEIGRLKRRLYWLLDQDGFLIDCGEVRDIKKQVANLWKQEEIYWSQRSRLKWLKWGDRNSRFFHAATIQRRDRNRLQRIKDTRDIWVEGQDSIFCDIIEHYSDVYRFGGSQPMSECLQAIPQIVSLELNEVLMAQIEEEEIKNVVFSMGALKASGPDGLNALFYQKN